MDHTQILKRAWHILWNYKVLWVFGFILALTAASWSGGGSSYSMGSSDFEGRPITEIAPDEFRRELEEGFEDFGRQLERDFEELDEYFSDGIRSQTVDTIIAVVVGLLIFFFLPYYFRHRLYTIPQFLEDRFDRSTRILFAGLTVIHMVLVLLAGALYAGGLIFQNLMQADVAASVQAQPVTLTLLAGILIVALTTGIYSVYGGLSSVVWTDVVQTLILLSAGVFVTAVALAGAGGWSAVWAVKATEPLAERLRHG